MSKHVWHSIFILLIGTLCALFPMLSTHAALLLQPSAACEEGMNYFYEGDYEVARPLMEEGYATLDPATATGVDADCAMILCSDYRLEGRLEESVTACEMALAITVNIEDPVREAIAAFTLGDTYMQMGDFGAALIAFQRSFDAADVAGDGVGVVIALTRMGTVYQQQGTLLAAKEVFELALETARDIDDQYGEQSALVGLGAVEQSLGNYAEAEALLDEALALARELDDLQGEADAVAQLGALYEVMGRYEESIVAYEELLEIAQSLGDVGKEVTALGGLGIAADAQGLSSQALTYFEEALALAESINDQNKIGHLLNNIGLVYRHQGHYSDAADLFVQALEIARDAGDQDEEAAALHNLGRSLQEQGRLAEALARFEQSLALVQESGRRAEESIVLTSIGALLATQGRNATALEWYEEALTIAQEIGNRSLEGRALAEMGLSYDQLERYEDAIDAYIEAVEIAQELSQFAEESTRMANLAGIYVEVNEFELARDLYEQARIIDSELGDQVGEVNALNNLSAIEYALGNDDAALALLEDALPLARNSSNPVLLGSVLANAGKLYLGLGEVELALEVVKEAITLVDAVRSVAGSEAGRAGFAERFRELYSTAVALYHTLERDEDAFAVSEQARARSFLDALATGEVQLSDEVAAALLAQQRELYAQWLAAQDELAVVAALPPPDPDALADAEAALAEAERAYQEVLATIEDEVGKLSELIPGRSQSLDAAAVQQLLDDQTTLLSFYILPEDAGALAFVLTHDAFQVINLPDATGAKLHDAIDDLTLWLDLSDPHPQPLLDMHEWLIAPLLPALTTPRLGIVPHQMLHYLPLAALSDGTTYLGDRFSLFLLPSASALPYIQANLNDHSEATAEVGTDVAEQALVYGNPASDAGLSVLVHAEEEANAISTLLDAPSYTGPDASETLLRHQAINSQILHLAAHGNYNQSNPLYSTIFLAPDAESDGRLEVHEVYGLDLTANELVVLSACETSLGQLSGGDELVGLTRAFFFAGAPTVIASLWSVDDLATKELMLAFYAGLQAGLDKATALQAAQAQIRPQYPSPYYWAAFVLNGDPGFAASPGQAEGNNGVAMTPPSTSEPSTSEPRGERPSTREGNQTTPAILPAPASNDWVQKALEQVALIWK